MPRLFSKAELSFLILGVAYACEPFVNTRIGVAALGFAGRTGACPYTNAAEATAERSRQASGVRDLESKIKSVQTDGSLLRMTSPAGEFWIPKGTDLTFLLSEDNRDIYTRGGARIKAGDIVLDCGANVGVFTRRALKAGAKLVIAIDPSPLNVVAMQRTFAADIAAGRVIVYGKGVWNKDDTLTMNIHDNSALDSVVMGDRPEDSYAKTRSVNVPLTTIDKLASELKLDRVDFIKMDIEGAERQALAGASETIRKWQPRMAISLENLPDDQFVVPQIVKSIYSGYKSECGPCDALGSFEIRPSVTYFF